MTLTNVRCGNAAHPDGAWHPAAVMPGSWEHALERLHAQRKAAWGCSCPRVQGLTCMAHGPVLYHDEGMPYCPECDRLPGGPRRWVHELVASLLVLWPRLGAWLHDRTAPHDPSELVTDDQADYAMKGR